MKIISECKDGFVRTGGRSGFEISKVTIQPHDNLTEVLFWWKVYYWPGREFVAHAPTRDTAFEQIEQLRNSRYTHLGVKIEE